jgi:hypothetical protein
MIWEILNQENPILNEDFHQIWDDLIQELPATGRSIAFCQICLSLPPTIIGK